MPIQGGMAYIPDPLPHEITMPPRLVYRLDIASRAVANLAGVGETLPNPHLLIAPFMRREAVLSSRIEGTQASISDVLAFEASGSTRPERRQDTLEVVNYVQALQYGLGRLPHLPISTRLANEIHERLLLGVRGEEKRPGELRQRQVWIGTQGTDMGRARFVPPPSEYLPDLMRDWERFVNADIEMPPLIRAGLMHYQFEAIHPYLDGNGRIGRLLIILLLCEQRVISTPLLYLSAFLERHRTDYYDHLYNVSATGDWMPWLEFFLAGVAEQAEDAIARSRKLRDLQGEYEQRLKAAGASANMLRLLDGLFVNPYTTATGAANYLGVTKPAARAILDRLVKLQLVTASANKWRRVYIAPEILEAIESPRSQ